VVPHWGGARLILADRLQGRLLDLLAVENLPVGTFVVEE
jgi:hypothetical protein